MHDEIQLCSAAEIAQIENAMFHPFVPSGAVQRSAACDHEVWLTGGESSSLRVKKIFGYQFHCPTALFPQGDANQRSVCAV